MELTELAVKQKAPMRRGTTRARGAGLTTGLRNHLDFITAVGEAHPYLKSETDKLAKQTNSLIDRARLAEDQAKKDDEFIRTFILTKCGGGRIEKWIRELPEVDDDGSPHHDNIRAKTKFRAKGWRTK